MFPFFLFVSVVELGAAGGVVQSGHAMHARRGSGRAVPPLWPCLLCVRAGGGAAGCQVPGERRIGGRLDEGRGGAADVKGLLGSC